MQKSSWFIKELYIKRMLHGVHKQIIIKINLNTKSIIQYIPRNMHTVFALLCFVVVIHWLIFPYPSGLLHWHCGNLTIAPCAYFLGYTVCCWWCYSWCFTDWNSHKAWYSISQEICTRFCCALLCCGYAIVHNEFTWSIYPYSSGLLCWHWGNR